MSKKVSYTAFQQRRIIEHYAHAAADRVARRLIAHSNRLAVLAIDRGATIGIAEYGDKTFHKPSNELIGEIDPELADAIWYGSVKAWVDDGRPDVWSEYRK